MNENDLITIGLTKEQAGKVIEVWNEAKKAFVPKADYDSKFKELNTANDTIKDLKKNYTDNAELQEKIKNYETELANLKTAAANTRKEYALKDKLKEAGVVDADYIIYKKGGLDKFTFDREGIPIGIEDILKPLKEESPHLFKTGQPGGGYTPAGGDTPIHNPFAKNTWNMTEQGKLFKSDPMLARQLAAAEGLKL